MSNLYYNWCKHWNRNYKTEKDFYEFLDTASIDLIMEDMQTTIDEHFLSEWCPEASEKDIEWEEKKIAELITELRNYATNK